MNAGPAAVVRITAFQARAGQAGRLIAAAHENARAAREATGCHSAEVCTTPGEPDSVLVVSRWRSAAALQDFLGWHERLAHESVSPYATARPHATHYTVVPPGGEASPGGR